VIQELKKLINKTFNFPSTASKAHPAAAKRLVLSTFKDIKHQLESN